MKSVWIVLAILFSQLAWAKEEAMAVIGSGQELQKEVQKEFERHDFQKVKNLYQKYVESRSDTDIPLVVQVYYGQSLANSGNVTEAIEVLQKVLARFPPEVRYGKLHYDLGNLLLMEKRSEEARQAFERVIYESSRSKELGSKARERLVQMKDKESKKKDVSNLQLIEIESALESGEAPDEAFLILQKVEEQNSNNPIGEQARSLLVRFKEVRKQKAAALLDEARRLFDIERKFNDVRVLLEQIEREYPDFEEKQSVEALIQLVDQKLGKAR